MPSIATAKLYLGAVQIAGGGGTPPPPDVQNFISSGTWTKPAGAKWVLFEALSGGQGYNTSTGGGGQGGNRIEFLFNADDLGATEPVTVGAGGVKGTTPSGGASMFGGKSSGVMNYAGSINNTGNGNNFGYFDGGRGGSASNAGITTNPGGSQYGAGGGRGSYNPTQAPGSGGLSGDSTRLLGGNGANSSTPAGVPGGGGSGTYDGARGQVRITTYF